MMVLMGLSIHIMQLISLLPPPPPSGEGIGEARTVLAATKTLRI